MLTACAQLAGVLGLLTLLLGSCAPAQQPSRPAPVAGAPPAAAVTAPPATAPPPAARVRMASLRVAGEAGAYIAADRGYFEREGLDVDLIPFASASEMIPGMATGQLEVASVGANPAGLNAVARGVPMKLVLDMGTFRPGQSAQAVVIRKDVYDRGRGHDLADVRGLTLAITPPGRGTTSACALAAGLQRVGLTLDDLVIQPLPFPEMVAAFANGAIDAGMLSEPFLTRALRQGTIVQVLGVGDLYPNFTTGMFAFTPDLYTNRSAAKGFVRAYVRAIRELLDARAGRTNESHRAELEEIIALHTGLDATTVHEIALPGFNPNGLPNKDATLYCYQFFREQGLIPEPVSDAQFAALWGTELVEEALQEIGRVPDN